MQAKQLNIAVAEDNADFRKALAALLKALGHNVVCEAGNGAELLDACVEHCAERERPGDGPAEPGTALCRAVLVSQPRLAPVERSQSSRNGDVVGDRCSATQ